MATSKSELTLTNYTINKRPRDDSSDEEPIENDNNQIETELYTIKDKTMQLRILLEKYGKFFFGPYRFT